ncbi:MAG: SIS domain-containing protein [Planctomycetota bacterium]|nr:MAG: SIS domain-containing protein [Planctomycetota bacterium]
MVRSSDIILAEVSALVQQIQQSDFDEFCQHLLGARRVMAYATGRSGFLLRSFIMRLNHLGISAYYVGDASTPPVAPGDHFLTVSGSGSTATSIGAASEAQRLGAIVIAILGTRSSPLGALATHVLELPAPHKRGVAAHGLPSEQTAGSLFEQGAFILLESLVHRCFLDQGHGVEAALQRHANLEA